MAILYHCCTMWCTNVHQVHEATFVVHDALHHRAPGARCYMSCTIMHWVHDTTFVVHDVVQPHRVHHAIWVVHDAVHPPAPGAQCEMGGAQCCAPSCKRCTMIGLWCTMSCIIVHWARDAIWVVHDVVNHHAPGP